MINIIRTLTVLTTALTLGSTASHALNYRSWVATNGDDAALCSRFTPCATLQGAYDKTIAGGEITCVDAGNFGGPTITKSITINCEGFLGSNASHTNYAGQFTVTTAAADRVILRGLDFDMAAQPASALDFTGAGTLIVDRVKVSGAKGDGTSGILFRPNGAGKLIVTDSIIANNGGTSTGAGILVKPQAGGSAQVSLERVNVSANTFGIAADGTGSSGGINMTIADSMIGGNVQDGIIAVTPGGGAPIGVMLKNTKSVNNNIGIRSIGPNVTVRVSGSSVIGNGTGLSFSGGGALLSFSNNEVRANGGDGAFSGMVGLQ